MVKVLARLRLSTMPDTINKNGEKIKPTGDSVLLKNGDYVFWKDEYENERFNDNKETIKLFENERTLSNGLFTYDWYDENGVAVHYGVKNGKCVLVPVSTEFKQ